MSVILFPMVFLSVISSRVLTGHIMKEAEDKVRISLNAALNEYNARGVQMMYGMLQAASLSSLQEDIKQRNISALKNSLHKWKEARTYVDIFVVVNSDREVLARLNSNVSGDFFEINGLVRKALTSGKQQFSSEIISKDVLASEGESFSKQYNVAAVLTGDKHPAARAGGMNSANILALAVVTPVFTAGREVIGAIISCDIINRDNHLAESMSGIVPGLVTTIASERVRIATNLTIGGKNAAGTLIPEGISLSARTGISPFGRYSMPDREYLAAVEHVRDHEGSVIGSIDVALPVSLFLSVLKKNQLVIFSVAFAGLVLSFAVSLVAKHKITRPLKQLTDNAAAFASGDRESRVGINIDEDTRDEAWLLARTFNAMVSEINSKEERLKYTLENLRVQSDKLQGIYDAITDYIVLIDEDLMVLEANKSFIYDFKTDRPDKTSSLLCDFLCNKESQKACGITRPVNRGPAADEKTEVCPLKRSVATASPAEAEITAGERILHLHSYPLINYKEEGALRTVVYIKDITEQRSIMQRLIQADKLSSLGELVAGVAHELNNPLTSIMGYSEILLFDNSISQDVRAKTGKIHESSQRCKRIIDNLLTFARWQKPQKASYDINRLITNTVAIKSYELKVHDIDLHLDLDASLPETAVDGYHLQQVFLNLLNNSQHAIVEKGDKGTISVKSSHRDNTIFITFSDTGAGIPENIIGRVFDPFYTTKAVGAGTGLGLSISFGIIKEHNGDIRIKSSAGEGTTIYISLPVVSLAGDSSLK